MLDTKFFVFRFDGVEVREREFCLIKSGETIPVEPKAFRVLLLLLRNPRRLLHKDELLQAVWGDTAVTENSLVRSIALLRRLLSDDIRNPRYIETVATVGYRFLASVEVLEGAQSAAETAAEQTGQREAIGTGAGDENSDQSLVAAGKSHRSHWQIVMATAATLALSLICLAIWSSRPRLLVVTNTTQITNDGRPKIPDLAPRTDGVHLYFVEGNILNTGIAQLSTAGGETTWIQTSLREIEDVPDISSDHTKLLVLNGVGVGPNLPFLLWIQPLPGGTPYRVGNITASSACFTPDGLHIVYGDKRVMKIANLDGTDPLPLADLPGLLSGPQFSPDGKLIRFWLTETGGSANARSIWEMNSNGTNLHQLLPNWKEAPDQCCGNWSPDGDYYFFQARRGNDQAIWVLPERHSMFGLGRSHEPFRLASGPLRLGAPSPSIDGKRLFVLGQEPRVELFHLDPKSKRFDPYLGGLSGGPVDFSPDGKWIAYIAYPDQTLWRSRLDLSEKMQLTVPPVRAYEPRWSPDGSRIAFSDVQPNRPWSIKVLSAAGGDSPKPIMPLTGDDSEADPTWTPDGKSIVFAKSAATGKGDWAIYRLNLDNGNLVKIPGSEGLFSPRLSPDGRFIAALKLGGKALMLFDQSTNQWSTGAESESFGFNEWSKDGKYVYMRAVHEGSAELVRMRVKDRATEDVLDLKDFPTLPDVFALWIGPTPDGGVLLMRDRSVQEIYAMSLAKK